MPEFNLNRWENAARTAVEKPPRKPVQPDWMERHRTPEISTPIQALRVTPEELAAAGVRVKGQAIPIKRTGVDVKQGPGPERSVWTAITPAMARDWLHNNFRNRPVKDDTVAAYARDMRLGRWKRTHQGIAFNEADELIDGQHRLLAIVQSGCTVTMMVTFGLPTKAEGEELTVMDCVDRGATRSVADQLVIQHGMKHGRLIAMVCGTLGTVCCGERTRRLSVGEVLEIYRAFQSSIDFVIEQRSKLSGLKAAGVLAGFAFARAAGWAAAGNLFLKLNNNNLATHPVLAKLRGFLTGDEAALLMRSHDRALVELVLQALFLEKEVQPANLLAVKSDGRDHFRALQPERVEKIRKLFKVD